MNKKTKKLKKKKRRKYKKKRYMLYYIIFGIILLTTFSILSFTVFFNIAYINITGTCPHPKQKIIDCSEIREGDNLILTDTKKAEKNIFDSFTDIDSVTITKNFPDSIDIYCEAAVCEFCCQKKDGSYILVSKNKRIIADGEEYPPDDIFTIDIKNISCDKYKTGDLLKLSQKDEKNLNTILNAIKSTNTNNITNIKITKTEKAYITFQDRITLEIENISKTSYFLNLCKQIFKFIGENQKGKIVYIKDKKTIHFIPYK